ncbi:MAG: hypothetical protein KatS3mg131_3128 [Candidatus Tectimicrobiota bacterium]|nr:MAG: hypothetical protein KatS3mg131_3128 [Candidatus Tectomicrobia bacterium]
MPHRLCERLKIGKRNPLVVRCVVDQDVKAAKDFQDLRHQALHLRRVAHIAGHGLGAHAQRPQRVRHGLCLLAALQVDHRHVAAGARQRVANPPSQPATAARDHRHRAAQLHLLPPQPVFPTLEKK